MISIICNKKKDSNSEIAFLENFFKQKKEAFSIIQDYPFSNEDIELIQSSKLLITIGGDGTILRVIEASEFMDIPILPIYSGTLGFICSITPKSLPTFIETIWKENNCFDNHVHFQTFKYDYRSFLKITYNEKNYYAFNEVALNRGNAPHLLTIKISFENSFETEFKADGAIISTASGSTAYNLSAGGPILNPEVEAYIFTPICPHSLTIKPVVIPGKSITKLSFFKPGDSCCPGIEIDGKQIASDTKVGSLYCTLSTKKIRLLKPNEENYYSILRDKLKWGI